MSLARGTLVMSSPTRVKSAAPEPAHVGASGVCASHGAQRPDEVSVSAPHFGQTIFAGVGQKYDRCHACSQHKRRTASIYNEQSPNLFKILSCFRQAERPAFVITIGVSSSGMRRDPDIDCRATVNGGTRIAAAGRMESGDRLRYVDAERLDSVP